MIFSKDIGLPEPLVEFLLGPSMELTAHHLKALRNRLNYVDEIVEQIEDWDPTTVTIYRLLDEIEVDALVILNSSESYDGQDRTFLIHSSWPSEADPKILYDGIPEDALSALARGFGKILMTDAAAGAWTKEWSVTARLLLDQFKATPRWESAIAAILAIDILLSNLVSFITAMRLNPLLDRRG